eukprot:918550-Pyramimonas_sp.AAC.1
MPDGALIASFRPLWPEAHQAFSLNVGTAISWVLTRGRRHRGDALAAKAESARVASIGSIATSSSRGEREINSTGSPRREEQCDASPA